MSSLPVPTGDIHHHKFSIELPAAKKDELRRSAFARGDVRARGVWRWAAASAGSLLSAFALLGFAAGQHSDRADRWLRSGMITAMLFFVIFLCAMIVWYSLVSRQDRREDRAEARDARAEAFEAAAWALGQEIAAQHEAVAGMLVEVRTAVLLNAERERKARADELVNGAKDAITRIGLRPVPSPHEGA